jgi:hypothetical protein
MQSKEWNNANLAKKFLTIGNFYHFIQECYPRRMLFLTNIHLNHVFQKYLYTR